MPNRTLAAAALALALAPAAFARVETITEVDVTADLTAIGNEAAAAYWANIERDLEAAIGARVSDRLGEEGAEGTHILVDLREVTLASPFEEAFNIADAVLVGQVNITDDVDNSNFDAYELSVTMEMARILPAPGETLLFRTDDTETYAKLVEAFADGVVERLK